MESLNAGLEAVAESYSITSSCSMRFTCNGLLRDYISYYHADRIHDSLAKDALRRCDPFPPKPANPPGWFHSRASAVCNIDTIGRRLPEEVLSLMPSLSSFARIG